MSSSPEFPSPRRLKLGAKDALWTPNSGIRFAPMPNVQANPETSVSKPVKPPAKKPQSMEVEEGDYFSDDEDFERFAAEWYDRQDAAAMKKPPPAAIGEQGTAVIGKSSESSTKPTKTQKEETPVVEERVEKKTQKRTEKKVEKKTEKKIEVPIVPQGPPISDCEYNMSKELFEAALGSKADTPESFWTYTMYKKLLKGDATEGVKINYCTNQKTMEWVCEKYFQNETVLGFDLEWSTSPKKRPGVRDNVSLIQLASPSRIALFHAAVFPSNDFSFPSLKKIMEDDKVSKVGVNIKADCTRLEQHTSIKTKGIFELSHLYKLVKHSKEKKFGLVNRKLVSLSTQTQEFLRLPLFKGKDVRMSRWSRPLVGKQISCTSLSDPIPLHDDGLMDV